MKLQSALAIETEGLVKRFGEKTAVGGIDLAVKAGTVYGVLGPNGAGKTTTIRMLATRLRPDGGSARVLGHDVVADAQAVRTAVSLTGQFASVDDELTGRENLTLIGRLLGFKHRAAAGRADELLAAFGLTEPADRLVKTYSGGMRRRLDIGTVRYCVAAAVILTVGLALGFRPAGGPFGVAAAVALLLVFAFSLSWVWTALGLKMPTPEAVMQTSMTVLFPVTFASNVFVDPQTMPGWVQVFVNHNPITHLATASRGLMHGTIEAAEVAWVLGWNAALVAVVAPLTMRLYNKER